MPFRPPKSEHAYVENLETISSNLFMETSFEVNIKQDSKLLVKESGLSKIKNHLGHLQMIGLVIIRARMIITKIL
jgi:adenine-specific DNA methylase